MILLLRVLRYCSRLSFICVATVCCLISFHYSYAQSISGVVNHYTAVTAINCNVLTVDSGASFNAGDTVLIIQMKGATIDQANTIQYGDITDYGDAGNYEFATIASVSGNTVTLQNPLSNSYDLTGLVQMINGGAYNNVTISSTLTCQSWNGTTGGILFLKVPGTITMNANIDVTGKGFRGGPACNGGFGCGSMAWYLDATTCSGGRKGEAIAEYVSNAQTGGRGKLANGGGGGNPGNCGGGGGANYGQGGQGGFEYSGCSNTIQGIGGAALDYTLGKIFMGGAGGTGYADNFQPIFPGTNGGGIVIIIANSLEANGYSINSNGAPIGGVTNDESAGGGGAGGSICLNIPTINGNLNVNANGANGGSTYNFIFATDCHGPGGGGGGGMLWISGAVLPANVIFSGIAGLPGLVQNPASSCFNTSFGGTPGIDGDVIFNFPPPAIPPLFIPVSLGNDTTICPDATLTLNAGTHTTYLWQDGSADSTFIVADTGTFYVQVTDTFGCTSFDTIVVDISPPLPINIGSDTIVCRGQTVTLDAGPLYVAYLWQDSSTLQTFAATDSGIYSIVVTDSFGCTGFDSVKVSNFNTPILSLGNDTSICPGTSVIFNAGNFSSYLWQDSSTLSSFEATDPGNYSVIVSDTNGCIQADGIAVSGFYPLPDDNLVADTVVCPNVPITIEATSGYVTYLWNDGSSNSYLEIDQPGNYYVTVTNGYTCVNTDTAHVMEECPTMVFLPTAFTPNSDGVNDVFKAIGYNITLFQMEIFNRWGQMIFTSNNLDQGWDGRFEGKNCLIGVYVCTVKYTGDLNGVSSSGELKGNVTLIR